MFCRTGRSARQAQHARSIFGMNDIAVLDAVLPQRDGFVSLSATGREAESAAPDFWNDNQKAQEHLKKLTALKRVVEPLEAIDRSVSDNLETAEMAAAENDAALAADADVSGAGQVG